MWARETSKIPMFHCSSGSETPYVTRNDSRDLIASHGGIALTNSCAGAASFVLASNALPASLCGTLYLLSSPLLTSTQRTRVDLIPLAIYRTGHLVKQLFCWCRSRIFLSNSMRVASSTKSPSTASKINLVSIGSLPFSQMRHGICELQDVQLSEFAHQRIRLRTHILESMLPGSMRGNGPCTTFRSRYFVGPFITTFHEFFTQRKSVVCTLLPMGRPWSTRTVNKNGCSTVLVSAW